MAAKTPPGQLQQLLGLGFSAAVVVGATIGGGILRTPGEVAAHLGSVWAALLAWFLGGIYALLGVLTVAELGIALPLAGGFTVYVRRAFGPRAGFSIGACDWLGQTSAAAFSALVLADMVAQLKPALAPWRPLVGAAVIAGIGLTQARGLRIGARWQEAASAAKALAFLVFIGLCFFAAAHRDSPLPATSPAWITVSGSVLAAQAIFYTYDGWYSAIYFTEEDTAPDRNLLPGLLSGTATVVFVYVLFNAALFAVLPFEEIRATPIPGAAAASRILGPSGALWIALLVVFTALPNASASLLMATRIPFALARQRALPASFLRVGPGGAPETALLATLLLALTLVLTGTAGRLLAIGGFFFVGNYVAAFACIWRLRRTEPQLPRPYRAWGYPWITGLLFLTSAGFLAGAVIADPINSLLALLMLVACALLRREPNSPIP